MKLLSNLFLFLLISASLVQNIQGCGARHRMSIVQNKGKIASFTLIHHYSDFEIKQNKEKEKYFALNPKSKINEAILDLERIFHQKIREKQISSCFVAIIGKKYRKNGSIKTKGFSMHGWDALRFLIKNRGQFHFRMKKNDAEVPDSVSLFFECQT